MVIHASQVRGSPLSLNNPLGGIICSGLTKSPLKTDGLSVASEPKPSPLTSNRLSIITSGWYDLIMVTSSVAFQASPVRLSYEKSNHIRSSLP